MGQFFKSFLLYRYLNKKATTTYSGTKYFLTTRYRKKNFVYKNKQANKIDLLSVNSRKHRFGGGKIALAVFARSYRSQRARKYRIVIVVITLQP